MSGPRRIAYLVSRFPIVTETFVLREIDALDATGRYELEIFGLLAPKDEAVHPAARRWIPRVRRPSRAQAAGALALWLLRRPRATLGMSWTLLRAHRSQPREWLRAAAVSAFAAALARHAAASGVERVHAHFAGNPGIAAWCIWRLAGIPYSVTTHAYDIYRSDQLFLDPVVAEARDVVTISEFNRRYLLERAPVAPERLHVIHCGVSPADFAFRPRELPAEGAIRIACVASMIEHKGQRHLLEALAGDDPTLRRMTLDLAGDGPLRPALEDTARRLGIEDRVTFHGSLPEEAVAALLDRSHVFALPSVIGGDGRMEGLPVALMEALAAGLPTVATRISGIPELVRDGETGWTVPPGDPEALRGALLEIASSPGEVARRAAQGRALVEREFDIERTAAELAAVFARG